jgi:GTP cyclohydrolase I
MTKEIADTIKEYLKPKGVAVVSEAYHMCMMMRGVEKQNSSTTSSSMVGVFKTDPKTRVEFLSLIRANDGRMI